MTFTVTISPAARRQIKKLERKTQERIIQRLRELTANPRPPDIKKMSGERDLYRARTGDYRIIYQIQDDELVILVLKAGHRREVYRRSLKQLTPLTQV